MRVDKGGPPAPTGLTPPLKWAGGKRWLVPRLRPLWAPHRDRRLVEPFCGALAVSLGLQPARALTNDRNPHLIAFWRWPQGGGPLTVPLQNERAAYDAARARFNHLVHTGQGDAAETAKWFYYLNRTGYNGLWRENRQGDYNVPFGRHAHLTYATTFPTHQAVVAPWTFCDGPFDAVPLEPEDFVYADPPYDGTFAAYTAGGFTWADHERLARWLARHPGPVVASNAATPRVLALYGPLGFTLTTVPGPRRISRTGDRTPALEVLATRGL